MLSFVHVPLYVTISRNLNQIELSDCHPPSLSLTSPPLCPQAPARASEGEGGGEALARGRAAALLLGTLAAVVAAGEHEEWTTAWDSALLLKQGKSREEEEREAEEEVVEGGVVLWADSRAGAWLGSYLVVAWALWEAW